MTITHSPSEQTFDAALLLAFYTRLRRRKLNLKLEEAARLAGLELSDWYALEGGWIPDDDNTLRSIAATLKIPGEDMDAMVDMSRANQKPNSRFTHK